MKMTSVADGLIGSEGKLQCASCGAIAEDDSERCPRCGAGFPRFKCIRCGTLLKWGDVRCSACGYEFEDRPVKGKSEDSDYPRQLEEPLKRVLNFQDSKIGDLTNQIENAREQLANKTKGDDGLKHLEDEISRMEEEKKEYSEIKESMEEMGRILKDMLHIKESGLRSAIDGLADEVRRRKAIEDELHVKNTALANREAELKTTARDMEELRERIHLLQEGYSDVIERQELGDKAKQLLVTIDDLLAKLPKKYLDTFANSSKYDLYEEVMEKLRAGK